MASQKRVRLAADLLINLALPWLAFHFAEPIWGEYGALLVSGLIGAAFLASLLSSKPRVYFLARAMHTREGRERTADFDGWWQQE